MGFATYTFNQIPMIKAIGGIPHVREVQHWLQLTPPWAARTDAPWREIKQDLDEQKLCDAQGRLRTSGGGAWGPDPLMLISSDAQA